MLRIILLITFCLVSFCCYPFSSTDSTKTEEKFKCPAPYKCIEVKMAQGLLLESIPLDQPIIIYAKNTEGFKEGAFQIYEVKRTGGLVERDSGSLRFDHEEKMIYAVSNRLMRANKTYRFKFHTSVPQTTQEEVNKIIIDALLKVKATARAGTGISIAQLQVIRDEFAQKITDFRSLVKAHSFLDQTSPTYQFTSDDMKYMDLLDRQKSAIAGIKTIVDAPNDKLLKFLTAANIKAIKAKNGTQMAQNLQALAVSGSQRKIAFSGRTNFENLAFVLPELDLATINASSYKLFQENTKKNIDLANSWNSDTSIPDRDELPGIIKDLEAIELKLRSQFSDPKVFINAKRKALMSTLVESIVTSIEGTSDGDFQQSSRWYVGADIGAIATNITGEADGWHVLPYVGMNLSVMPVNKETSIKNLFREYKALALLKLASINAGVTITKINTEKNSGIYDVENQRGFILGIGLRPWRGVKLGYGYLMLNKKTGNSLNTSSRAISGKPYFSVSLDWDLRKIIPDVKNIFTN